MAKFIIQGNKSLSGTIKISGSKNAATPIIAATLLTDQICVINNLPWIKDVEKMLNILKSLGSEIQIESDKNSLGRRVKICNKNVHPVSLDKVAVKSMRSSILFLGPLLARFGQISLPEPGGCLIGNRPLDIHFYTLTALGAKVSYKKGEYHFKAKKLKGNTVLPEFSVTVTENLLMAACLAEGQTIIKTAACEPHVQDLCYFLEKLGAEIKGLGTHTLIVTPIKKNFIPQAPINHVLIPDQIEAGTFAVLGAVTRSQIKIENIIPEHLEIILLKFKKIGMNFEIGDDYLITKPTINLKAFHLQTLPWPGFPTDLQAPFGLLATQCRGTSLIHETIFESRFGYISELIKMGAKALILNPHQVSITGPRPLYGQEIKSYDLRAGATLIIAGLLAQGQTIINEAEIVDRGYERIEEKLRNLGAEIRREG